jgi:hypothetical protein
MKIFPGFEINPIVSVQKKPPVEASQKQPGSMMVTKLIFQHIYNRFKVWKTILR